MELGALLNYGTGCMRMLIPDKMLCRQLTDYCSRMYPFQEDQIDAAVDWTFSIDGRQVLEECAQKVDKSVLIPFEHDISGFKGRERYVSWFLEAKQQWALQIDHANRLIRVWIEREPFQFARKLIRQIISSEHQKAGAALIHASAVEFNGEAYLIVGNKGAGKTTLMMKLLATGKTKYLGNDAILLTPGAKAIPILAGPFVGLGTLYNIKEYRHLIPAKFIPILENRQSPDYDAYTQKKISFGLEEIEDLLTTSISRGAKINGIIFPTLVQGQESVETEKLQSEEGAGLLQAQIMYDPNDHQNWLEINPLPDIMVLKEKVKQYTRHIRMFKVKLGTENTDLMGVFERLVSEADI